MNRCTGVVRTDAISCYDTFGIRRISPPILELGDGCSKGPQVNDQEAAEMLELLTKHFHEPVLPISKYCKALETWASLMQGKMYQGKSERGYNADHIGLVSIDIHKSNLLYRLLYLKEPLRKIPCPIHNGRWSGCFGECVYGCDLVGWLPTPVMVSSRLEKFRAFFHMTDDELICHLETRAYEIGWWKPTQVRDLESRERGHLEAKFQWAFFLGRADLIPDECLQPKNWGFW